MLGGGAFAWVYEAVDRDLEIPVALKILRPEFAGQTDNEARFRREAATAARLRHPNIVTVRDVGQVDGASYVAMDLLPLSLARRLELLHRLPESEVVRIGLDVAAALSVAHAGGIVHRDIKPDNILIGPHGEAVVADFGLARALDAGAAFSGSHQVVGTPHYFSPEQARGLELDGRSDLYSLGVTLFRAATGRLPFEGDDWYAVARAHADVPPPSARTIVPELTEEFDRLIDRLLKKSPSERYRTAIELADALASLPTAPLTGSVRSLSRSTSETVTAFPPVAGPPPVPARRTPRWVTLAVGAAVVTVVAVAGWATMWSPVAQRLIGALRPASSPMPADSTSVAGPDSATPANADSTAAARAGPTDRPPLAAAPPVADSTRRKSAATVRTQLTLSAPDSAMLYVDGALVGRGSAVIDRPSAARLSIRAVIASAPANCPTASRDSTVRLAVGERRAVALPVRTCVGVTFTISPTDARIRFVSLDGGVSVDVRADTANAVLLPEGRYEVRAAADRCMEYRGDTLIVKRGAAASSLSRTIRMACS